jgi:hypothetical protein
MKTKILFIIIFSFSIFIIFANTQQFKTTKSTSATPKKIKEGVGSDKWLEILSAFEKHDLNSKILIEKYAKEKYNSLEKKLAEQLLKEWEITENLYDLMHPFPLKYGKYKILRGKKFAACTVIIELKVTEIGSVEEAKLIKSPIPNLPIDLSGFKQSAFRPAFDGKKFVPGLHQFGIQLAER